MKTVGAESCCGRDSALRFQMVFIMIRSLSETLTIIESHLPLPLVSIQATSRIKTLAGSLPDAVSSYYLECRLAADSPQVDFLACVTASDGGREILAGPDRRGDWPNFPSEDLKWNRVCDFFSCWVDPCFPLRRRVPHIWLEFDLDRPFAKAPPPCLLLCLDPAYFEKKSQPQHLNDITAQEYQQVINTALEILLEHPISLQTRKSLFSCFDLLPVGGQVVHASVMLSRKPLVLKLNISLPKDQLLDYLRCIGWTGSIAEIETILSTFCQLTDRLKFQLTVENIVSSKIDFEFYFDASVPTDVEQRFLLDQAVANSLCTPEKRDALLAWPGSFTATFSHHSWPTRFYKWIDVKIIYQLNHFLEAKGYLAFMPSASIF